MKNNFLIEYERELIESAVESAVKSTEQKNNEKTAKKMLELNYPPEDILEITGIDVLKK